MPQPQLENKIIVNDLLIHYWHWPTYDEKNPSIVFLHGWRLSGEVWLPIIRYLLDKGYNIFSLDLPGFGRSEMPAENYTLADYADVVEAFIQKMKIRDVILVGHSFGGRIAIKLVAKNPGLFKKLVLANSAGFRNSREFYLRSKIFLAKIFKFIFKIPFFRMTRIKIYKMIGADDYITLPDEMKKVFVNIVNEDLTDLLPKLGRLPTLIIWGDQDKETPISFASAFRRGIANSELVILPRAGHLSFFDQPLLFSQAFNNFIEDPKSY
ncbi:MAG: alpha/beta hydrolase [Candidatus Azambacteria bacterium]|nr:alpha/beta hydrolase [Candidatus Azambacteria bacterium]